MIDRLRHARAGTWVALGALTLAALLCDLGSLHRLEHGDSLVPVLVSLQRWTPFYWDQERYGMLVPLLALPVRDPLGNLLLQRGLLTLAGLAAVVLLARHALAGRDWRLCGLVSAALLVALAPAPWLFEYLGDQPYGLSLALALLGLAWAEPGATGRRGRGRLAGGLVLSALAHWVNAATGAFLIPVALARAAADRAEGAPRAAVWARLRVDVGLLGAGLAVGQVLLRLYPVLSGHPLRLDEGTWPVSAWPGAWATLLSNGARGAGAPWLVAVPAVALLGLLLGRAAGRRSRLAGGGPADDPRRTARAELLRTAALVGAALAYALFLGTLRWVSANEAHWRYLAPPFVLIHVAAVSLLVEPLARARRLARPALAVALALVPLAALAAYGPPSLDGVRADLDRKLGAWTEDVLAARCDLVAGDYWSVWPAVWHAGWMARQRGLRAPYGVTHRTNPTVRCWSDRPREALRICRVRGPEAEQEAERWLRAFHLWPVREVERRATVDVLMLVPGG